MKWTLIINPASGGGKAKRMWPRIQSALDREGLSYSYFFTEKKGHAIQLVRELAEQGEQQFVVVGGDGTLNEAVNGLCSQQKIPLRECILGCIPIGTASDWVKHHGIPTDIHRAVLLLKDPQLLEHDVGMVIFPQQQSRYFINIAGLAFDAFVVQRTENNTLKGRLGRLYYLWVVLRSLKKYPCPSFAFSVNGQTYQEPFFCLNVGICKYSGGGMMLVPEADVQDGLFDITAIDKMRLWEVLWNIRYLYNGKIYEHKKARRFRAAGIEAYWLQEDIPLEVDGEFLGFIPARFSVLPQKLKVVVTSNNSLSFRHEKNHHRLPQPRQDPVRPAGLPGNVPR